MDSVTRVEPAQTPCPVCGGTDAQHFFRLDDVPTVCNRHWTSPEEAVAVRRAAIDLALCADCSHVYNASFDETLAEYTEGYGNPLHGSTIFRDYAEQTARHLLEGFGLRGKTILELGCGDGYFLRRLCELGDNRGIGFDRSLPQATNDGVVSLRAEDFVPGALDEGVDFVVCRHVVEHASDPTRFVDVARRALAQQPGSGFYFEVPNGSSLFETRSGWDILYEHVSYFSAASLSRLCVGAGLDVRQVRPSFAGQYLSIEGYRDGTRPPLAIEPVRVAAQSDSCRDFATDFEALMNSWRDKLRDWKKAGEVTVLWGAGTKGVMFLNHLGAGSEIDRVVDISPGKHGLYVPGTGHRICSPKDLTRARPQRVIVMNEQYEREIREQLADLGVDTTVCVV